MPELHLDKLFRSTDELVKPEESHINGKIPEWATGSFIRVGPGKFDLGEGFCVKHWFDGYSILSKFDIKGDRVTFHKRFLQSDAYRRAINAQRPVICEFGTRAYPDPTKGMISRILSSVLPIELTDNGQLNVFKLGKDLFATSETSFFREIHPGQLKTGERFDTNKLFGTNICTAHPLTDAYGATYNLGASVLTGLKYNIIKIPAPASNQTTKELLKKAKIICTISSSWTSCMSYTHSFGMSKNYIIFIEQPYVMNIAKAFVSVFKGQAYKEWLEWRPELKNRFFIIDKNTGKTVKTDFIAVEPFFFLHLVNCYEENNQIVVDVTAYPDPGILENMSLALLRERNCILGEQSNCLRFVVPLVDIKNVPENINLVEVKSNASAIRKGNQILLVPELISQNQKGYEFSAINPKFLAKKYSFFYATGNCFRGTFTNALCKFDTSSKQVLIWKESPFHFPGEPAFIPNPSGVTEDDGIIIAAITDTSQGSKDFLIFLNAKTMKEVGRAQFKSHIPQSIHGLFLQNNSST